MATVVQVTDPGSKLHKYWCLVKKRGGKHTRLVPLIGPPHGNKVSDGILMENHQISENFIAQEFDIDQTHFGFRSFPVTITKKDVYGSVNYYYLTSMTSDPQTSNPRAAQLNSNTSTARPFNNPRPTPTLPPEPVKMDQEVESVPLIDIEWMVRMLSSIPNNLTPMIWGPPGVGKSEGVAEFAASKGRRLYDVRLPLMDPVDLRGTGVPDLNTKKTVWLEPSFLPSEPGGVLLLDEISAASPSLQVAAYQLILNHRVGDYDLPPDTFVICAGNRESDRAVSYRMPSALANRMLHFEVKADINAWRCWAVKNMVDARIISFLSIYPQYLHQMNPNTSNQAWPSPRSWNACSQVLKVKTELPGFYQKAITASVGGSAAQKFLDFVKRFEDATPIIKRILEKGRTEQTLTRLDLLNVVAVSLVAHSTLENLSNILSWLSETNSEIRGMVMRMLDHKFTRSDLMKNPAYVKECLKVSPKR